MKGFAPTIHGIARSNAQVTIRQTATSSISAGVPPGAFTINDLLSYRRQRRFDCGSQRIRRFLLLIAITCLIPPCRFYNEGRLKYAATVAEYRSDSSQKEKVNSVRRPGYGGYRMVLRCMAEHTFQSLSRAGDRQRQIWAIGARCRWMSPVLPYAGG